MKTLLAIILVNLPLLYLVLRYRHKARVAEESLKAMDEFCLIAIHELKTPITALRLQIALIQRLCEKKTIESEYLLKGLKVCSDQTVKLIKLIEVLLDVTRMKNQKVSLDVSDGVDLSEIVDSAISQLSAWADSAGVPIVADIEPKVLGKWDRCRVDQVIVNLLTNGIKYGNKKPVTVRLKQNRDQATIEVIDNGIGIPDGDQKRIFKKFERAVSDKNGLGLGLYLTQEIVKAHNGSIALKSNPSEGSVFTVTLPKENHVIYNS